MLQFIPSIHRLTHQIAVSISRAKLDVSQGEAHILAQLASEGDCTIAELHRAFAHKRSTLTSILDRLVQRGLVTREVSQTDRRSFAVSLTYTGRPLAQRVLAHLEGLEDRFRHNLDAPQQQQFQDELTLFERSIRDH